MSDSETLRQKGLQDSEIYENKRRFGLFSQPISTAIGDDGAYKTRFHPREEEGKGKPITKPRNFQSGPCRSGQLRKSYFGDLNSLASSNIKDQYIEVPKRLLHEENQTFKKGVKNEAKFIPASGTGNKSLAKSSYPYQQQNKPELDPKRNRESDGRVKSKLRNAYANTQKNVINSYFKHPKHMEDPYDRAHTLQLERQKKQKSLQGKEIFKPNCFKGKILNKDRKVFGEDVELKKKKPKQPKFNITAHEGPWKFSNPNKSGIYGYFTPFPEYMENPPREIKRRESSEKKQVFKSMNSSLTTPTSSITSNPTNIRRYVSNSFSHRL